MSEQTTLDATDEQDDNYPPIRDADPDWVDQRFLDEGRYNY